MNDRILNAIKKLKEQQDDMQVEFKQIQKQLDKSGNFYLQRLMRQMEEDISNYSIQDGYWYFNGRNTGIKAEGIDGKDGSIGPQGKPGRDGKDGAPGRDGKDGKPGKDGAPGKPGKDGAPGRDGKDGKDGKDAILPTFKIGKVETSPEYGGANAKFRIGKDGALYLDLVLPRGPQGFPGFDGKDAKINGTSTLNIAAGENITLEQDGDTLKINSTGGGGTSDYSDLTNKPSINDVTLSGNKSSSDLGLQSVIDSSNKLDADLVDDTNSTNKFVTATDKSNWNAKGTYSKPDGGIPSTDLSEAVQTSLGKANSAVQDVSGKEDKSNKVTSMSASSTDTQYPSAKAVYDALLTKDSKVNKVYTINSSSTNEQYPSAKAVYDEIYENTLLHYMGHVEKVIDLPSTGQDSAPEVAPVLSVAAPEVSISIPSNVMNIYNNLKSSYKYLIWGGTSSSSSASYYYVKFNEYSCIDGVCPLSTTQLAIHLNVSAAKPAYVFRGSLMNSTIYYDDETSASLTGNSETEITRSGWILIYPQNYMGSYVIYNINNLDFKLHLKFVPTRTGWVNTAYNTFKDYGTGRNYAEDDYVLSPKGLVVDTNCWFDYYDGGADANAVENNVYTVGEDNDVYRCNATPAWEKWVQNNDIIADIGTLSNLTTTEKSSLVGAINEVDGNADTNASNIGTLSSLTTTEKSNLVGAVNEVDANIKRLNLSVFKLYNTTGTGSDVAATGCTLSGIYITLAKDSTGSVFKCYGIVYITPTASGCIVKLKNTGIHLPQGVTDHYGVSPCGFVWKANNNAGGVSLYMNVYDNEIHLQFDAGTNRSAVEEYWLPFIIFNNDFGDVT